MKMMLLKGKNLTREEVTERLVATVKAAKALVNYRVVGVNSVVINNYTRDSLPWRIPTSAKDSNWRTSFEMTTEPIDIRKARKLRIELTFQVDNITIKRVIKARRHFRIWFEPRQGFRWIAPEDIDLLESII